MTESEKSASTASPSPIIWRGLGLAAVGVLATAVLAISLISAGVFDPQPAGDLVATYPLDAAFVTAGNRRLIWLEEPQLTTDFTLRLTASLQDGEEDSGYGLATGNETHFLAAAVSPLGYVSVWEESPSGVRPLFFWQPWPHVEYGRSENEIQIDMIDDAVTVRVNRERLWHGRWQPGPGQKHAGLYAESFAQPAGIAFHRLEFFAPLD